MTCSKNLFPGAAAAAVLPSGINPKISPSSIEVTVELPGLDEKDVGVTLADGVLTLVEGEKKSGRKEEGRGFT